MQFVDDKFQTFQFCKEIGFVIIQGVAGAQTGNELSRIQFHTPGANGGADASQQIVDAYRTKIRTFACHICSGDNNEERTFFYINVITYTFVVVHQWMSHRCGAETERPGGNNRVGVIRMIIGECGQ